MLSAITRIDRWLTAHRPEYHAHLLPGIGGEALDALERRFSLRLPVAFRELYGWRNGQPLDHYQGLDSNWAFMPLGEVAERKDLLDGMIGEDFDDPRYWRRGWVPFLHNGGGSHLCVDVVAEDGGVPGQVIEFWKADADRPVRCPSVDAWLVELADAMEREVPGVP